MDVTATTPSPSGAPSTLFVALELSRSTWIVALHSPVANTVSQHRIQGGDVEALLALIVQRQKQAETKLGRPVRIACCFEAGYDGFWLHRWLCARGVENRVLDAASLLVDRRARRAKTDRLDAAGLLRTLMALERGETQVCRVVHVPTPEQEDARRRSRERTRLVVERGQHTNRIKALLMTQGIRDFEPTRRDWQERLDGLHTADGQPLAPCLRAELRRVQRDNQDDGACCLTKECSRTDCSLPHANVPDGRASARAVRGTGSGLDDPALPNTSARAISLRQTFRRR